MNISHIQAKGPFTFLRFCCHRWIHYKWEKRYGQKKMDPIFDRVFCGGDLYKDIAGGPPVEIGCGGGAIPLALPCDLGPADGFPLFSAFDFCLSPCPF